MLARFSLIFVFTAAACAYTPAPPFPDRCTAGLKATIGHNIGEFTLPSSLPHRIVQPGAVLEARTNPARANFFVDEKGWILDVTCG